MTPRDWEAGFRDRPSPFGRSIQQSFLRLTATPQPFRAYGAEARSNCSAWTRFELLRVQRRTTLLEEPVGTVALWQQPAWAGTASAGVWMDAHRAAFAIAGGLEFVTPGREFPAYERHGLKLRLLRTDG